MEWDDVHLDREQFASLLKDMGVSVEQSSDPPVPAEQVFYETGDPGRNSSKHLYMAEAKRRFETGDVPPITELSRQLAEWLKGAHPLAAQPTPRTIENRIRPLWHDYHSHKRTK